MFWQIDIDFDLSIVLTATLNFSIYLLNVYCLKFWEECLQCKYENIQKNGGNEQEWSWPCKNARPRSRHLLY